MAHVASSSTTTAARPVGSFYLYNGDLRDLDQDEYYATPPTTFFGWLSLPLELRDRIRAYATHDDAASQECVLRWDYRVPPILQTDSETRGWSRRLYLQSTRFMFWINPHSAPPQEGGGGGEPWSTDDNLIQERLVDARRLLQGFVENVLGGDGRLIQELILIIGSGIFSERRVTHTAHLPVATALLWREMLCTIKNSRFQPQHITWKFSDPPFLRSDPVPFWHSGAEVVYFSEFILPVWLSEYELSSGARPFLPTSIVQELGYFFPKVDDDTPAMGSLIRTAGLKELFLDNVDDRQGIEQDPCRRLLELLQKGADDLDRAVEHGLIAATLIDQNEEPEQTIQQWQSMTGLEWEEEEFDTIPVHAKDFGFDFTHARLLDSIMQQLWSTLHSGRLPCSSVYEALNNIVIFFLQKQLNLHTCALLLVEYALTFRLKLQLLCNNAISGSVDGTSFDVVVNCSPYFSDLTDWSDGLTHEIDYGEEEEVLTEEGEEVDEYPDQEPKMDTESYSEGSGADSEDSEVESEEDFEEADQPVDQAGLQGQDLTAIREAIQYLGSNSGLSADEEGDSDEEDDDDAESRNEKTSTAMRTTILESRSPQYCRATTRPNDPR